MKQKKAQDAAGGANEQVEKAKKTLHTDLVAMADDLGKKMATLNTNIESEKEKLTHDTEKLKELIEHRLEDIGTVLDVSVDKMVQMMNEAQAALHDMRYKQEKFEFALSRASTDAVTHEEEEVDSLHQKVAMLDLVYMQLQLWVNTWQKHDLKWKHLVTDKLKEMGAEISTEELRLLKDAMEAYQKVLRIGTDTDNEMNSDIAGQRGKVNKALADVMERGDRKIAEILANKDMTDAEKDAAIKRVHADTNAEVSRIYSQQANLESNTEILRRNIAKYATMVDEALDATSRAKGEGILSSKADTFRETMAGVMSKIKRLKNNGFFPSEGAASLIEVSSEQHKENVRQVAEQYADTLEQHDALLEAEDRKLQEKIQRLKVAIKKTH